MLRLLGSEYAWWSQTASTLNRVESGGVEHDWVCMEDGGCRVHGCLCKVRFVGEGYGCRNCVKG